MKTNTTAQYQAILSRDEITKRYEQTVLMAVDDLDDFDEMSHWKYIQFLKDAFKELAASPKFVESKDKDEYVQAYTNLIQFLSTLSEASWTLYQNEKAAGIPQY